MMENANRNLGHLITQLTLAECKNLIKEFIILSETHRVHTMILGNTVYQSYLCVKFHDTIKKQTIDKLFAFIQCHYDNVLVRYGENNTLYIDYQLPYHI